jgi:hypothetical protein
MLVTVNRKRLTARPAKRDKRELPEDANSARVQHQRKRELHRISQPALGKGTKQMSVCNEQDIRRILSVHVVLVDRANLLNEVIKTVRHLLRRPVLTWSDIVHRRRLHINPKEYIYVCIFFKEKDRLTLHSRSRLSRYPTRSRYPNHAPFSRPGFL